MAEPVSGTEMTAWLDVDGSFGAVPLYFHNELRLSGRASVPGGVEHVSAELDGRRYFAECASTDGEDAGAAGTRFELAIDARNFLPGVRTVRVVAEGGGREIQARGRIEFSPHTPPGFTEQDNRERLHSGEPAMWVEQPWLDGSAIVHPPVMVAGWAAAESGISSVHVYVDDGLNVRAVHGFPAPHMRKLLGESADTAGFALTLSASECAPGEHTLTVVVTARDGRAVGLSGPVVCTREPRSPYPKAEAEEQLTDERYVPEAHAGFSLEPEHHARYRWVAPLAPGRRVLDAACGTGFGSQIMLDAVPLSLDAFDLSRQAVNDARRRVRGRASIVEGDLAAIPFADDSFDLVVCFEAIEHIADVERGLDELQRVLAPGGILAISTPNRGVYAGGNPHHLHEFTSHEFDAALSGRFGEVAIWRQDTVTASLIAGDGEFEQEDPSLRVDMEVRKIRGANVGSELYMVALASETGPLPPLGAFTVLGRSLDQAALLEERDLWRRRVGLSDAAWADARSLLRDAVREAAVARRELEVADRVFRRPVERFADSERQLVQLRAELESRLTWTIELHDRAVAERDAALRQLDAIAHSKAWRLIARFRSVRDALRR